MELTDDALYRHYIKEEMTAKEIAKLYSLTEHQVKWQTKICNLCKIPKGRYSDNGGKPLDCEFLRREYINKNKTSRQIAKEGNFSFSKVIKGLGRCGIKKPPNMRTINKNSILITKGLLADFFNAGNNTIQAGEYFGVSSGCIRKKAINWGIEDLYRKERYQRVRRNEEKKDINRIRKKKKKEINKELNRKRSKRRTLRPPTPEKRLQQNRRSSFSRSFTTSKENKEPTPGESLLHSLLKKHGIPVKKQIPIGIYDNQEGKIIKGYCLDFLLSEQQQFKMPVAIEVDGRHHHTLPANLEKDALQNAHLIDDTDRFVVFIIEDNLTFDRAEELFKSGKAYEKLTIFRKGLMLVRIWEDEISDTNLIKMLMFAFATARPALIRFYYPKGNLKKPPKQYLEDFPKLMGIKPFSVDAKNIIDIVFGWDKPSD